MASDSNADSDESSRLCSLVPVRKDPAVHGLEDGIRHIAIYVALYQGLSDNNDPDAYKQFSPEFFDLIIVDECHRRLPYARRPPAQSRPQKSLRRL